MAEACDRAEWNRTFAVMAQMYNANRDPKTTQPVDPMRYYPWDRAADLPAPPPAAAERERLRRRFPGRKT